MKTVNRCMKDSMKEKDPDASISKFIEEVGSTLHCRAICVYSLRKNGDYGCSYYWKADGSPLNENFQSLAGSDMAPGWNEEFHSGKTIVVDGIEQLRALYPGRHQEELLLSGMNLMILSPIILEKELYGFVVFVDPDRKYMALENQMFEIEANFLAIMLRHKHNADYILESSTHDELTGVLSINAFWNHVTPLICKIGGDCPKTRNRNPSA